MAKNTKKTDLTRLERLMRHLDVTIAEVRALDELVSGTARKPATIVHMSAASTTVPR